MKKTDPEVLWDAWFSDNSRENMNALLEHYYPLVRKIASKTSSGLPPNVEEGDMASYGVFGLMRAIERYEPSKGRFESFAAQRIRGSMIDELRVQDWAPRSVRAKAREMERARERIEHRTRRHATNEDLAEELGLEVEDVWKDSHSTVNAGTVSLDVVVTAEADEVSTMGDVLPEYEDDFASLNFMILRERVAKAIEALSQRERVVFVLYYFEQYMLSEVSVFLGITESRACQIHTHALENVESALLLDQAVGT